MSACSDSPFGTRVFESIKKLYECRKWEPRVFKQCCAQITQAYKKHTGKWIGFEISITEYVKEISIITFAITSTQRHEENPKLHHLSFSTSSFEWSVALVGYAIFATVAGTYVTADGTNTSSHSGNDYEVNKPARKATACAQAPLKIHSHHSPVVITYTDAGWTTRPDGTSQGGQLVFIANSELLSGRESNMSLKSWHSNRLRRAARSSSAAETQATR